jgi:tetratricopeptide (TPR) repeat protein
MISGKIIKIVGIFLLLACILQPVMAAGVQLQDNATLDFDNGEIAISNGQFAQAVQYFNMALADNTTLLGEGNGLMYLYKDKAAALAELGQYDEAMKTVNLGIIQFPNNTGRSGLWNNKGYIYQKQGDYTDAADAYNNAVGIDPTYLKGWLNLGNASVEAGRYSQAVDAYTKALALDPNNTEAETGLTQAENGASPLSSPVILVLVVIIILAAGSAVWYIKFRKTDGKKPADKKAERKKK